MSVDPAAVAALLALAEKATKKPMPRPSPCPSCLYSEPGCVSYECDECKSHRREIQERYRLKDELKQQAANLAPALCESWLQMRAALEGLRGQMAGSQCSNQICDGFIGRLLAEVDAALKEPAAE